MTTFSEQLIAIVEPRLKDVFVDPNARILLAANSENSGLVFDIKVRVNLDNFEGLHERLRFEQVWKKLIETGKFMRATAKTLFANKLIEQILEWDAQKEVM